MPDQKPETAAEVLATDIRNLIVMDTQYGWRGSTELKHEDILRLEARGWVAEGHENDEYDLTDEGRAVVEPAPLAPADVIARVAAADRGYWYDGEMQVHIPKFAQQAGGSAPAGVEALARLIADDGFACTFQSMGQYRSALLREVRRLSAPAAVKDFLTTADVEALGKAIFEAHREQCVGTSLWPMRGWDEVEQSTRDHWTHIARRLSGAQQAESEVPHA